MSSLLGHLTLWKKAKVRWSRPADRRSNTLELVVGPDSLILNFYADMVLADFGGAPAFLTPESVELLSKLLTLSLMPCSAAHTAFVKSHNTLIYTD